MKNYEVLEAVVREVTYGKDDHGILTCFVRCEGSDSGWGQGFGGLCLDERTGPAFVREVCAAFGVCDPEAVRGAACRVTRDRRDDHLEVLEGPAGRVNLTDCRRRMWPDLDIPDADEAWSRELRARRDRHLAEAARITAELADAAETAIRDEICERIYSRVDERLRSSAFDECGAGTLGVGTWKTLLRDQLEVVAAADGDDLREVLVIVAAVAVAALVELGDRPAKELPSRESQFTGGSRF